MLKLVNVGLGEQIRLFNNIGIEISSKCNRHCFFCPNGYFDRYDNLMDPKLVTKILEELRDLKYSGRIEWYIYNEPTRDKRLGWFIRQARELVPRATQMINTNGDYFKSAVDIKTLFDDGLNQMQINVYSGSDGSKDLKVFENGVRLAKQRHKLLQQWVDELTHVDEGGLSDTPYLSQKLSLYQNIGPKKKACQVIAKYGIKTTTTDDEVEGPNHFSNRSGNIPGFRGVVGEPLAKHCTRPFRFLNINWNGDAMLCCNDYYGQATFGNVGNKTLVEIWNDFHLNVYRLKLQNKKRDCFLCHNCDFDGGYYPHMIDNVTFGAEMDKQLLNMDLSKREDMFNTQQVALPVELQGKPIKTKIK